jgi:hypothetical protein
MPFDLSASERPEFKDRQPLGSLRAQRIAYRTRALVKACRAELDGALNDWCRLNPNVMHDVRTMGPHPSEACRLPHEHAAANVLNIWGHLHPVEVRTIECASRLIAQRKAGWTGRAADTLKDLRWYLADRVKLRASFHAAVSEYLKARATIHMPIAA